MISRCLRKSFSKRSPGIWKLLRKGGKYVYTLVPTTDSHSLPPLFTPPTQTPLHFPKIPANSHHPPTHPQRSSSPIYPLSKDLSLDVKIKKKKMIFIVRMIVNVRTLLIVVNSIYGYYEYFVATFWCGLQIGGSQNLHDPSGATTRYVSRFFFFFVSVHAKKKKRKRWGSTSAGER